jgi:FAD/FMN-containing dehydrogenase
VLQCDALASALPGKVFTGCQKQYTDSLDSYYSGQEGDLTPSCIVAPVSAAEVAKAVEILSASQLSSSGSCKFAIRGGGHTPYAGSANIQAGVTIDLGALDSITVDDAREKTSIGPGVLWGEVYTKLDSMQLSVVGGRSNLIGIAGLSLGGASYYPHQGSSTYILINLYSYSQVESPFFPDGTVSCVTTYSTTKLYSPMVG